MRNGPLSAKHHMPLAALLMLALLVSAACTLPLGGTSQKTPCGEFGLSTPGPLPPVSSVVVQAGVVYAGAHEVPQGHSYVYAFDARSGTLFWRHEILPPTSSQPDVAAVAGGAVYVGVDDNLGSFDQFSVLALRASDGSLLWSVKTGGIGIYAPVLAVIDGVVYASGTTPTDLASSGTLYALRASDGKLLWQQSGPTDAAGPFSMPTIVGNVIYVYAGAVLGSAYASIYALRVSDGQVIWSRRWDRHLATAYSAPVVVDGVLYTSVMATGSAYALRASDGAVLLHAQVAQSASGAPLVARGMVYVIGEGVTSTGPAGSHFALYALNASDGTQHWHRTASQLDSAADRSVYVEGPDPTDATRGLFALDAVSGAIRWVHDVGLAGVSLGPVASIMYVDAGTSVFALDAATGNLVWRRPTEVSSLVPVFTLGSGGVYFGSGGYSLSPCGPQFKTGYLYALDARTGAVLWRYQTDGRPG